MNFNFLYSLDNEIERINNTLNRINFYNENNYKIFLPKDFNVENNNIGYIKNCVLNEYKIENYKKIEKFLQEQITNNQIKTKLAFNKTDFKLETIYNIYLTKYGVGGSYYSPNKIILNFQAKEKEKLFKTIVHETIHLCINELITKYDIIHWEKEFLVDLIFEKILPEFNVLQKIDLSEERKNEIKEIFNSNFPNTENIIKRINKVNF